MVAREALRRHAAPALAVTIAERLARLERQVAKLAASQRELTRAMTSMVGAVEVLVDVQAAEIGADAIEADGSTLH